MEIPFLAKHKFCLKLALLDLDKRKLFFKSKKPGIPEIVKTRQLYSSLFTITSCSSGAS
jgi:hypothetical protein